MINIDPENPPLQPLRITRGWKVTYNNGLYEVDPTPEAVAWWWIFKSDMLTLVHEEHHRTIDVGWSREGDVDSGAYRATLYDGGFRDAVLHTYETRDRLALVAFVEGTMHLVTESTSSIPAT